MDESNPSGAGCGSLPFIVGFVLGHLYVKYGSWAATFDAIENAIRSLW